MLKLRELRKERQITQQELAKILKLSVQTISGYETGYAQPPLDTLIAMADYFQCSVDELLDREDYGTGNVVVQGAALTEDEKQLLELYRALPIRDKAEIIGFAKGLAF